MKYKLTDRDGYTRRGGYNETLWGENVTHTAIGKGHSLCSDEVIHYYDSPEIAAFMNPIHADIKNPICWECKGKSVANKGLKGGCKKLTTLKQVNLPEISITQRVEIAIRLSLLFCIDKKYIKWANDWLDNKDRTARAADDARAAVYAAHTATYAVYTAPAAAAAAAATATYAVYTAAHTATYAAAYVTDKKITKLIKSVLAKGGEKE